jgi:hypothetical protein
MENPMRIVAPLAPIFRSSRPLSRLGCKSVENDRVRIVQSLIAFIVLMVCLGAAPPATPAPTSAPTNLKLPLVKNVIVQFADGTEQTVAANTPPATRPVVQPSGPPFDAPPGAFMGVNLEGVRDYDRAFMFINVIKSARRFGNVLRPFDGQAACDADGWPADDAGTLVMTELPNIDGIYKFSATGVCQVSAPNSPATVKNQAYDAAHNRTTADVIVAAKQPGKLVTLTLMFRGTRGGLRDIKLLRPGYPDDRQVFTGEFLLALHPFKAIRFMDFLKTNNSMLAKWADRPKITDAQYTGPNGAPYEIAIDLGNASGKDIWLNVPALADDEFITELGKLIRARLRPDLHCYIEYSNEVWNGQFKQYQQNMDLAKAEVAAGEITLNENGKDTNPYYWARKRVARRSIEIKKLLGADVRIRMVLASQLGYRPAGSMLKQQLEYVAKHFGPPADYFYAVAGAPYFSPGRDPADPAGKKWITERSDLSIDLICNQLLARADVSRNDLVTAFRDLARQYHLKSFAYEAGLDMQQFPNAVDIKCASQYDPRCGEAVEQYLGNFYAGGGDALFYYDLSGRFGKNGYWGLTEDIRDLSAPKYQAAARVSESLNAR